MIRALFRLVGLAFLAGIVIPPIAAAMTKRQLADAGRGAFEPEANDLDAALIFEGGEYASTAPAFTGGELLTWYGGGRVDLRGATLAPGGADLRIRAIFGGLQLVVPPTWRVEATTSMPLMGGVANATTEPADPDAPVLRLSVQAIFGGVAVANESGGSMAGADIGQIIRSATEKAKEAVGEATSQAEAAAAAASAEASEAFEAAQATASTDQAG